MKVPAPSCRVCGSNTQHYGSKKSSFDNKTYDYYRCDACRFMCVHPFPGYHFYDQQYYEGRGPDPLVNYDAEFQDYKATDRVDEFEDILRIARNLNVFSSTKSISWLDYGCGAGGLLKFLKESSESDGQNHELVGYDIGEYADRLRRSGMTILSSDQLKLLHNRFDVISCIEVAEHVFETKELFHELARLLKLGGVLILTTGNLGSIAASAAGIRYRYLMPEIHISLFRPSVVEHLYLENGLTPVWVQYQGTVHFKVLKSIRNLHLRRLARVVLKIPGVIRLVDRFYGVSSMPCARKPTGFESNQSTVGRFRDSFTLSRNCRDRLNRANTLSLLLNDGG